MKQIGIEIIDQSNKIIWNIVFLGLPWIVLLQTLDKKIDDFLLNQKFFGYLKSTLINLNYINIMDFLGVVSLIQSEISALHFHIRKT